MSLGRPGISPYVASTLNSFKEYCTTDIFVEMTFSRLRPKLHVYDRQN